MTLMEKTAGAKIVRTWRLRSWWRSGIPQGRYADLIQDIDGAFTELRRQCAKMAEAEAEEAMLAASVSFPHDQAHHAAASIARRIAAAIRGYRDLHHWDDFLRARVRCIDEWTREGVDPESIAYRLSMDEQQVRAILAARPGAR